MTTISRILVATDFSESSEAALVYGREMARRFGATLHLLHVAQNIYITTFGAENYAALAPSLQRQTEDAARKRLLDIIAGREESAPDEVPVIRTAASPALAIVDYARDHGIDFIVMGTHGRGALEHLVLGSVAERVVRLAPCPVLTVKHPQHELVRSTKVAGAVAFA